jgi:hypothetical protein
MVKLNEDEKRIYKFLANFLGESKEVGGSEGLYQSLFYSHARRYFPAKCILREVRVKSGFIDFVIETEAIRYAFELKGGANGHRNSLRKMKEEEGRGKGLAHDLTKLHEYRDSSLVDSVLTFLVCIDIEALDIAFSMDDCRRYAQMARSAQSELVYFAQTDAFFRVYRDNEILKVAVSTQDAVPNHPPAIKLLSASVFWRRYFSEVGDANGLECLHVGIFYHHLRRTGLRVNQCAPEIFFNCNKYNTRSYHRPDLAVFEDGCTGQFQLFGDSRKIVQNDQFKLPFLASILEFKGGAGFDTKGLKYKTEAISKDLAKLTVQMPPLIDAATEKIMGSKSFRRCLYIMVVTDPDPSLADFIMVEKERYADTVEIQWIGDYVDSTRSVTR